MGKDKNRNYMLDKGIKRECAEELSWPSVKTIGYRLWPLNVFPVSFQMSSPLHIPNYNITTGFVKCRGSRRIGVWDYPDYIYMWWIKNAY